MNYARKVAVRFVLSLVSLIAGAAGLILGLATDAVQDRTPFAKGYLIVSGAWFIVASLVMTLRNAAVLRDRQKLRRVRVEEQDERYRLVAYRAGHFSMMTALLGLYLSSFYFAFANETVLVTTTVTMAVLFAVYIVAYWVFNKIS